MLFERSWFRIDECGTIEKSTRRWCRWNREGRSVMMASAPPLHSQRRTLVAVAFVAAIALIVPMFATRPAEAIEPPFNRGIDQACLAGVRTLDRFADVAPGNTHAEAISCLWAYGVAQGRFVDTEPVYEPQDTVTRQQMASFIARMLGVLTDDIYTLPQPPGEPPFEDADAISAAHVFSVNQLVEAGIVEGFDDGTYRPTERLDRAQMASFIARSLEDVTGQDIPRSPIFTDVSGTHQANIEKLATIGVTVGRDVNVYAPDEPITRAQMASFIARSMDYLVALDLLQPLAFEEGTAGLLGLTEIDAAIRDGFDRVTLTFEGDERSAGYRIRYVDQAWEQGTGDPIDVEGETIIRVILTGMALPPDLDQDLEDAVTELIGTEIALEGPAIAEVVVGTVFEGQQQIFIGTTGRQDFTVGRLDDPQRVFIDVEHP